MAQLLGGISNAFSDRNFRIYSLGSITSWITYFVQNITFSWVAWDVTHSTTWLALVSSATTITTILFLPLGGVLADRAARANNASGSRQQLPLADVHLPDLASRLRCRLPERALSAAGRREC